MAHKIRPTALRMGITAPWTSRWFFKKKFNYFVEEDCAIRDVVKERILSAGIDTIGIERTSEDLRVTIRASRPGLIIGRGGKGIDELRLFIEKKIQKLRRARGVSTKLSMHLNIEELKRSEASAQVIAQQIAFDIEKRMPFRTVMKHHLEELKQNRDVRGAKIKISGRLNGAEISRTEWLAFGRMPLQTFRANVDYGDATSFNSYGAVGIKLWIYKGEIFEDKLQAKRS